ncbi:hypothetical protein V5P93_004500 [Actinokineospora auranticolor]|uniref:Uncharacterized protein n=1 Tax=Actinokineospora auranticolor TaxID=155976 RepID=A0A2S6GT89_9PSEU|nr:hypothetical protein [Actinokineospora auranticolor]PPK68393.1 hypothetical protein CLV40_105116 [Actinokineospora auranticolor]
MGKVGSALSAALAAGIVLVGGAAEASAEVGASSAAVVVSARSGSTPPSASVLATWRYYDWYWLYDRCATQGRERFGHLGIRWKCVDLGSAQWALYYWG